MSADAPHQLYPTAKELLSALGGRHGMARCPAHRDRSPSLSVRERAGKVLFHCFSGCTQDDVIEALRSRGLWPERREGCRARLIKRTPPPPPEPDEEAEKKTERACEIWRSSTPLWDTSSLPAMKYLKSRSIPWPWPETLAFGRIEHFLTKERNVPALIVARQCPKIGMVRGILAIFIAEDGQKITHAKAKVSLGSIPNGAAQLMAPAETLILAEGPETALSASWLLGLPAWACCGPFTNRPVLPSLVRRVILFADHDRNGASLKNAKIFAAELRAGGRKVSIQMSDTPGEDANDVAARLTPFEKVQTAC